MSHPQQQSSRKRRWGVSSAEQSHVKGPAEDAAALQALLASAESHQQQRERQKQEQKANQNNQRNDRSGSNPRTHAKKPRKQEYEDDAKNNYYGPASNREDAAAKDETAQDGEESIEKEKPNFGLSGALTKERNTYKGVVLKFQEPPEARTPNTLWRFYVFQPKQDDPIETLHISRQSAYLLGRNEDICDIPLRHPSCSSQHAVIQYRALPRDDGKLHCQPYLMDLESTNGTMLNGVKLDAARYYQLKKGDVVQFGASTREYVLLTAHTKKV